MPSLPPKPRTTPPNILLIVTDQQQAKFLGCYGHPVLSTPNIDSISARGVRFERCFVAAPVCMPNRASLMTGRMPSVHGVRVNGIPLSAGQTTFVELLRAGGYRTAMVGKSHLQNMLTVPPYIQRPRSAAGRAPPPPKLAEAQQRFPGRYDQELPERWQGGQVPERANYYGFEHTRLVTGHGDGAGGDYLVWLEEQDAGYRELRGQSNALPADVKCPEAWRTAVPEDLYPTSYIAREAIEFLKQHTRKTDNSPFFLTVSFPDPHHPFTPPGRFWSLYDPADMQLAGNFYPDENALPQVKYAHDRLTTEGGPAVGYGPTAVDARDAREAMALTCGMIAMIDDAVGRILAALRSIDPEEETVVVFTADHGDFLGDHGLLRKGPLHFQSLLRVPLIVATPRSALHGQASTALASTIDISATLLDLAGLAPCNGMQGQSLAALLAGETESHREQVLIEEDAQSADLGWATAPRLRTLVSERHRLTIYDASPLGELFDLVEDPLEIRNLWNHEKARSLKFDMIERLARAQMDMADTSPWPTSLA